MRKLLSQRVNTYTEIPEADRKKITELIDKGSVKDLVEAFKMIEEKL